MRGYRCGLGYSCGCKSCGVSGLGELPSVPFPSPVDVRVTREVTTAGAYTINIFYEIAKNLADAKVDGDAELIAGAQARYDQLIADLPSLMAGTYGVQERLDYSQYGLSEKALIGSKVAAWAYSVRPKLFDAGRVEERPVFDAFNSMKDSNVSLEEAYKKFSETQSAAEALGAAFRIWELESGSYLLSRAKDPKVPSTLTDSELASFGLVRREACPPADCTSGEYVRKSKAYSFVLEDVNLKKKMGGKVCGDTEEKIIKEVVQVVKEKVDVAAVVFAALSGIAIGWIVFKK